MPYLAQPEKGNTGFNLHTVKFHKQNAISLTSFPIIVIYLMGAFLVPVFNYAIDKGNLQG
jgi:hypothetical protein